MRNEAIADIFSLLAKLMDIHGENAFKAKSYASAAYAIEQLPQPLEGMDAAGMAGLKGIGASTAGKVEEILRTGRLAVLDDLLARTPAGILEMLKVKGLGPKKIATVWREMGIETLGELLYACEENRLLRYKGFGEKTQQQTRDAVEFVLRHRGAYLLPEVEEAAGEWQRKLSAQWPDNRFAPTGDFLRERPTIDTLEWVTDAPLPDLHAFLAEAGCTVETAPNGCLKATLADSPKLLFHASDKGRFAWTVFRTSATEGFLGKWDQVMPSPPAEGCDEEGIFTTAGVQYIPACRRESAAVIDAAIRAPLPEPVRMEEVRGIIHAHSDWSDGVHTIEAMAAACRDRGMEYLAITDHSRSAFYANGLQVERVREQHARIDALNKGLAPFRILKGIECDILNDGGLDYPDEVLAQFDIVIASVHANLKMPLEKAMDRLLRAIAHPYTDILGHMTGRLLLSRPGYPVDHGRVMAACAANGVAIELNAHPRRLDIDWEYIPDAVAAGVMVSINPDAHSMEGFDDIRHGVRAARKGGLTARDNLSSLPLEALMEWLQRRRRRRH